MKKNVFFLLLFVCTLNAFGQKVSLVKDFSGDDTNGFSTSSDPIVARLGNSILLVRQLTSKNWQLWISSGTANTTLLLTELESEKAPTSFISANNKVIFQTATSTEYALWQTDGTVLGTKKICTETDIISNPTIFKENLYYGTSKPALVKYDFKTDIKENIYSFTPLYGFLDMTAQDNELIIMAGGESNGASALCLFTSDGTAKGTKSYHVLNTGSSFSQITLMTKVNKKTFFFYTKPTGSTNVGYYLYATDGTSAGTVALKKFQPESFYDYAANRAILVWNDKFVFRANTTQTSGIASLWISDGTVAGTIKLDPGTKPVNPQFLTLYKNEIYFQGDEFVGIKQVYKTGGTKATTSVVLTGKNLGVSNSFGGADLLNFQNLLYFSACTPSSGCEAVYSDGTENNTNLIDINAGELGSNAYNFLATDSLIYCIAKTPATGYELYAIKPYKIVADKDIIDYDAVITLSPNPSNGILNIDYNKMEEVEKITIQGVNGQQYSITTTSKTLDLTNFHAGMYILQLHTRNKLITRKFILQP
jgi:ELWxxDGT repeat protein